MTAPFNWTCDHCQNAQTVTDVNYHKSYERIFVGKTADGPLGCQTIAIGCQNPECLRTTVLYTVGRIQTFNDGNMIRFFDDAPSLFSKVVIPRQGEKPQPPCVPAPLVQDYQEACRIVDDSPKAAATLIRRCLQGMIRDFAGISKATLYAEITALKTAVEDGSADRAITSESVDAIDHVRSIGNIGAHMEKDINLIVPVDAGEARTLIELVEMLFVEWYVSRESRRERLSRIAAISTEKEAQKQLPKPGQ